MAGEVAIDFNTGKTCYFQLRNRTSGFVWNNTTAAFEAYLSASGSLNSYALGLTEQGTASQHYVGNVPSTVSPGSYDVTVKERAAAFYAESDATIANGQVDWNGSRVAPISDASTSGQVGTFLPMRPFRGQMIRNFPIYLKSSVDHITPMTSGVVSGQIARDGGNFGVLQSGAFAEIGLGWYDLQALTSGDLLANTVKLIFTADGVSGGTSDPLPLSFVLQRSSGQTV